MEPRFSNPPKASRGVVMLVSLPLFLPHKVYAAILMRCGSEPVCTLLYQVGNNFMLKKPEALLFKALKVYAFLSSVSLKSN